jgi:Tfp pilus assembly protein PilF
MTLQGGSAMSTTLNMVDSLLASGQKMAKIGRPGDALRLFKRLASFGDLSPDVAETVQARLAEIQLRRGKTESARRHLTVALAHQPDTASYHAMMARALAADDRQGDRERALDHYREALRLDSDPAHLSEFGALAVRMGQTDEGFAALRRAVQMSPTDPEITGRLVQALAEEGLVDEARRVLLLARFQNSRDLRFRKLYNDFQFRQLRRQQQASRYGQSAVDSDAPRILPFVRPVGETLPPEGAAKIIRHDGAAKNLYRPHRPGVSQPRNAS